MPLFVCSAKGLTSEEPGEQLPVAVPAAAEIPMGAP